MKSLFTRLPALAAVATVAAAGPLACLSQTYPTKPIRLISQFPVGSGGDRQGRLVTNEMGPLLGQPVVVENRPGAAGIVAINAVVGAAPDGYTLLLSSVGPMAVRVHLVKNTKFSPFRDVTPIGAIGELPTAIYTNTAVPVKTLRELIEYARANPGKLSYGTTGVGSQSHLAGEQIQQLTGVKMTHIPYKDASNMITDIISGQLPLGISIASPIPQLVRTGKVNAHAILAKRSALMPELPAVSEIVPGFEAPPAWAGFFGPAGLPDPITRRLHADIVKAMNVPEARDKLLETGTEFIVTNSPAEFTALMKRQTELVGRIIKAAGIPPTDD